MSNTFSLALGRALRYERAPGCDHVSGAHMVLCELRKEQAYIIPGPHSVQLFPEGFDSVDPDAGPVVDSDLITDAQLSALDAAGSHQTAIADEKHILDHHAKHARQRYSPDPSAQAADTAGGVD